jgi:hypothetical protein
MAGRTILSRILGSAVILKLAACAAWLGLPVTAAAFHQDADTRSGRPAVDDRKVPLEYDVNATEPNQDAKGPQRSAQIWSPPPPPPPRPPAVLSVRG